MTYERTTGTQRVVQERRPWTPKENELLRKAVERLGTKHWTEIAKIIPGRTARRCREHWNACLNPNLNKGPWTPEEDRKIIERQRELGNQWAKIALFLQGRSDYMVKNRWHNVLKKQTEKQNPQGQPTVHQQPLQPAQSTDAEQPDTDSTTNYAALFDASEDFERTFDECFGLPFDL